MNPYNFRDITSPDIKYLQKSVQNLFDMCRLSKSVVDTIGRYPSKEGVRTGVVDKLPGAEWPHRLYGIKLMPKYMSYYWEIIFLLTRSQRMFMQLISRMQFSWNSYSGIKRLIFRRRANEFTSTRFGEEAPLYLWWGHEGERYAPNGSAQWTSFRFDPKRLRRFSLCLFRGRASIKIGDIGGLKIWEGSIDMCNYLESQDEGFFAGKNVLEVCCILTLRCSVNAQKNFSWGVEPHCRAFFACWREPRTQLCKILWVGLSEMACITTHKWYMVIEWLRHRTVKSSSRLALS